MILDLGNYHISQYVPSDPSDQVPFGVAILVPDLAPNNSDLNFPAIQSVYIQGDNAIISDFSMYGIRVMAHTSDIQISNITIKNVGNLASLALRPFPQYLPHSFYEDAGYGPNFGVAGLCIGESEILGMGAEFFTERLFVPQYRVNEVIIENVFCLDNFFDGICMANTTDVTIRNCHFNGTFSDDPGNANGPLGPYTYVAAIGGNFAGLDGSVFAEDPNIQDMVVINSTFNNSQMLGQFTTPIFFEDNSGTSNHAYPVAGCIDLRSKDVVYSGCQFNSSIRTFGPTVQGGSTIFGYLSE